MASKNSKRRKTGRKGGPITKAKAQKIKEEITSIILRGKNIYSNEELGEKFNVSRDTISNYLKDIYESMKRRLVELWDKAKYNESVQEELKILKEIRDTIKDFTDMLERYHVKAKAVDNVNMQVKVETISDEDCDIIVKDLLEIK